MGVGGYFRDWVLGNPLFICTGIILTSLRPSSAYFSPQDPLGLCETQPCSLPASQPTPPYSILRTFAPQPGNPAWRCQKWRYQCRVTRSNLFPRYSCFSRVIPWPRWSHQPPASQPCNSPASVRVSSRELEIRLRLSSYFWVKMRHGLSDRIFFKCFEKW